MLILDKQKAVEHMVALAAGGPVAEPEPRPVPGRARTYQRVARYERRPVATDAEPTTRRRHAIRIRPQTGGIAPA